MSIKILLVEDNYLIRLATKVTLDACDCDVDFAVDGKETLSLLKHHQYDLVFMDLGLPDIKGTDLTKQIRANKSFKKLPIVALTSHSESEADEYREECLAVGMNDFLLKPLVEETVYQMVEKFVPHKYKK